MFFADISAAFLQGDYLPETRRVFVQSPEELSHVCPTVPDEEVTSRCKNRSTQVEESRLRIGGVSEAMVPEIQERHRGYRRTRMEIGARSVLVLQCGLQGDRDAGSACGWTSGSS